MIEFYLIKRTFENSLEGIPWNWNFTKTPLAIFLVYYFLHIRVSIPGRFPLDQVNFFKLQEKDSSSI